jgi:hypothetical protein
VNGIFELLVWIAQRIKISISESSFAVKICMSKALIIAKKKINIWHVKYKDNIVWYMDRRRKKV